MVYKGGTEVGRARTEVSLQRLLRHDDSEYLASPRKLSCREG